MSCSASSASARLPVSRRHSAWAWRWAGAHSARKACSSPARARSSSAVVCYEMWSGAGDARAFYDHVRAGASLPPGSDTWSSGDDATVQGPFFSRGSTLSRNAVAVALCADTRFSIYVVAPTQEQAQAGFAATTTAPASEIPR
ncbi:hypothetical protein [Pseudonocardia alni]|uniref:hypothetical protein n=1 Tax=Pseudonocardia alni TaxID=33907 RepID=UPI0033297EB0